jgi:hypothetical protein
MNNSVSDLNKQHDRRQPRKSPLASARGMSILHDLPTVERRNSDFGFVTAPRRNIMHVAIQASGCEDLPVKLLGKENEEQVYKAS